MPRFWRENSNVVEIIPKKLTFFKKTHLYSTLNNDYEMTLKDSSEISLCTDAAETSSIPTLTFNFAKIGSLDASLKDRWVLITILNENWPQCGNFRIFLSLRFYVNSILENQKFKNCTFCEFLGSEFCYLVKLQPSKSAKIHKNQNWDPLNVLKWQI